MMVLIVVQISAVGMLLSAQPEARFDALNSKLASLEDASSAGRVHRIFVDAARLLPDLGATHRQNPQQRSLAGILKADHGDVHLCGPAVRRASAWFLGHV